MSGWSYNGWTIWSVIRCLVFAPGLRPLRGSAAR